MVDQSDQGNKTSDFSNRSESAEVISPPKPPEKGSSVDSASRFEEDLKSILVTSVLNLETLDLDLYR